VHGAENSGAEQQYIKENWIVNKKVMQ